MFYTKKGITRYLNNEPWKGGKIMLIELDSKILHKTTDCDEDFQCLSNENQIYCKKRKYVNNVHFAKCPLDNYCYYILPFRNDCIYTCPTRKAIFISTVFNR